VYDPYSKVTFLNASWGTLSSSAYSWIYLFQGGRSDPTNGLNHFDRRDDSPTLGRWMTIDPLAFQGGDVNLYRYVANNPGHVVDPRGLDGDWVTTNFGKWTYEGPPEKVTALGSDNAQATWKAADGTVWIDSILEWHSENEPSEEEMTLLRKKFPAPWDFTISKKTLARDSLEIKQYNAVISALQGANENKPPDANINPFFGASMFIKYNIKPPNPDKEQVHWIQFVVDSVFPLRIDNGESMTTPFYDRVSYADSSGFVDTPSRGFVNQTKIRPLKWKGDLFIAQQLDKNKKDVCIWQGLSWGFTLYKEGDGQ
jgi:RHS repeat-associated protein